MQLFVLSYFLSQSCSRFRKSINPFSFPGDGEMSIHGQKLLLYIVPVQHALDPFELGQKTF